MKIVLIRLLILLVAALILFLIEYFMPEKEVDEIATRPEVQELVAKAVPL